VKADSIFLDWIQFHNMVRQLHVAIHHNERTKHDNIIALSRGGLPLGTILSNMFDIPLFPVSYSAEKGKGTTTWYNNKLEPLSENSNEYNTLIIDDLVDTGKSLKGVVDYYYKLGYRITTATLYYKTGSIIKPDYYVEEIPPDVWVYFPWEI
jgi:hypoxanthine phosphoribosyltransferase